MKTITIKTALIVTALIAALSTFRSVKDKGQTYDLRDHKSQFVAQCPPDPPPPPTGGG